MCRGIGGQYLSFGGHIVRIAAAPAFRNKTRNPYNALLYSEVQQAGADVREFEFKVLLGPSPDVLHIHWPEWLFSAPGLARAKSQAALFRTIISGLRSRGTSVVWTAHNIQGHIAHHPVLEQQMWDWFVANIDGWISLTQASVEQLISRYPHLRNVPHAVIPHGHYREAYPRSCGRDRARDSLGIPCDARVFSFVGRIEPYKQIPKLASAFARLAGDDLRLVLAGKSKARQHEAILAAIDQRVLYHRGFVPDAELQIYHRAADVVVLPYRELQNSGSAILALSFDVPVLVPNTPSMQELQCQVGEEWVMTYDGDLTHVTLAEALEHRPAGTAAEISSLNWDRLGQQTLEFYRVVTQNRRPTRVERRFNKHARV